MRAFLKRWWWVILLVAVALGFWRLRFSADVLDLLPPDEPTVQGLKLYEEHFTKAEELVITIDATNADLALGAARKIGVGAARTYESGQRSDLAAAMDGTS